MGSSSSNSNSDFEYAILGAGIAGLSLADSLRERGFSVCVVEKETIASGASGTPLGMINPATGRRATKTWRAEECYAAVTANLEKVKPYSDRRFYRINGVLRPALTAKIARKMREQYEKTRWPDGWCEWLSEAEIKQSHPGINCVDGGLWLPVGTTVDVAGYLEALGRFLGDRDVPVITGAGDYELRRDNDAGNWEIQLSGRSINSRRLVFATGYATTRHPWWRDLDLHPIKGQIAVFKPENPLSFTHSVSSLGYIARLTDTEFAQGSTYEHEFDSLEPDEDGEEYLRNRLKRTLPQLEDNSKLIDQWAGVRISTPNRKPVAGMHREIENLYIYTALGSKGLMYGKYLADHFAGHLVEGKPLLKAVAIDRFYKRMEKD